MLELLSGTWRHRDLVLSFALRDIKARYKQTMLGLVWALLQPLSMMVVFTLVFSVVAGLPSEGVPYPIFAYSGIIFWTFFASAVSTGTTSMVANAALIRKIYFPRETLITSVLLAGCLDLGIASLMFVGMMLYYGLPVTVTALWVIPLLGLQMLLALAITSLTAAAHVNFRDIGHALPLILQLWMFASPVGYSMSMIPEWLRPFYILNPMAGIVDGFRRALVLGTGPDVPALVTSTVVTVGLALIAFPVFRRAARTFADVI